MAVYVDMYRLEENSRIKMIGEAALAGPGNSASQPAVIGFIVETNEKADRYLRKLKKRFPTIRVIDRHPGPTPGTIIVRVGPPLR